MTQDDIKKDVELTISIYVQETERLAKEMQRIRHDYLSRMKCLQSLCEHVPDPSEPEYCQNCWKEL